MSAFPSASSTRAAPVPRASSSPAPISRKYTKASLFAAPGKETPVFVRFSTVMNFRGSPEAARDPRGFAVKFYTDQGNWDLVGINEPVFFIRDAIKFPDFVHANKPSPVTNVQDPNRAFDFFSHVPESTHMLTQLYTDTIGMPASYRTMDGHGVHAFRLVNNKGETIFAKFHWKSQQGLKGMTLEQTQAADTNYATKDLYQNIGAGNFPKWDLYVQLLTPQQVEQLSYDGFDDTKIWSGVPEVKIGTMTLNKVPDNFFDYTEQSAFCPCAMVPGIEASPDRMLQGRLFAYADTQRYRVGPNYMQLPVNRPLVAGQQQQYRWVHAVRPAYRRRELRADERCQHTRRAAAVPLQPVPGQRADAAEGDRQAGQLPAGGRVLPRTGQARAGHSHQEPRRRPEPGEERRHQADHGQPLLSGRPGLRHAACRRRRRRRQGRPGR